MVEAGVENFKAAQDRKVLYRCCVGHQPQLVVRGVICDEMAQIGASEPSEQAWLRKW